MFKFKKGETVCLSHQYFEKRDRPVPQTPVILQVTRVTYVGGFEFIVLSNGGYYLEPEIRRYNV